VIWLRGVDRPVNPYDNLISHPPGQEVTLSPEVTQGIQYQCFVRSHENVEPPTGHLSYWEV
jgi:hypothetical protein